MQGSPFGTGTNFTLTYESAMFHEHSYSLFFFPFSPQYKRIAAFQGDYYFQAPRRYSLAITSATQKVWSYCTVISRSLLPCC